MTDEKNPTLPSPTEVVALPPLRMVLVHAKDERENRPSPQPTLEPAAVPGRVKPQTVKKLIEYLEKN